MNQPDILNDSKRRKSAICTSRVRAANMVAGCDLLFGSKLKSTGALWCYGLLDARDGVPGFLPLEIPWDLEIYDNRLNYTYGVRHFLTAKKGRLLISRARAF